MDEKWALVELCDIIAETAAVLRVLFLKKQDSEHMKGIWVPKNENPLTEADKKFIASMLIRLKLLIEHELNTHYPGEEPK